MSTGAPALSKLLWQKRLRGADLTPVQYMVLLTLSTYADRNLQNAHPGWKLLTADTRLDLRTVRAAVRALERAGYLVLMSPGGNQYGKGTANVYRLTLPVVHKGDTGSASSDADASSTRGASGARRGTSGARGRGASDVVEGGHQMYPHQITTSGISPSDHHHHSESKDSGMAPAAKGSWLDLIDDLDECQAWLDGDLNLTDSELITVGAMWEANAHPNAIRNTIIANRRRAA